MKYLKIPFFARHDGVIGPHACILATVGAALIWAMVGLPTYAMAEMQRLEGFHAVTEVMNGKSMKLENGAVVRLAAIQAPNMEEKDGKMRPGEPLGQESQAALASLVLRKKIRLDYAPEAIDRHNRHVAQLYLEDGRWVQGEMLKLGMAMVYSFPDTPPDQEKHMLAVEQDARTKSRGIWANPYYQIILATRAGERMDRFAIIEGTIREVAEVKSATFLNFGEDWKSDFTLRIDKRDRKLFKKMDLAALTGKNIRVRGWVYSRNGPMIDLTHPTQLEMVE